MDGDAIAALAGLKPPFAIGQIGQSLDGRIATASGHSHYVNGPAAVVHLHRLRALADAVVVGVGTALADDPRLTVRHVPGRNPARVVLDPQGRLPATAALLAADGARRILVHAAGRPLAPGLPAGVEGIALPAPFDPHAVLAALAAAGLPRVLVEGGAATLSGFLAAGALDRLHVLVAPLLIGAGPFGLALPPVDRLEQAIRPPAAVHLLGGDVLFDLDLRGWRDSRGGR